jgi:phage gpG-like protein
MATFEQFAADMAKNSQQMAQYIANDLPRKVGVEGVRFFKQNFRNEGFTDQANQPWPDVKRRTNPNTKGVARTRKILHGETSELQNSLDYNADIAKVTFGSDLVYARVHNEGLRAGRGAGFTMKKRQFVGPSTTFDRQMVDQLTVDFNRILGT